MKKLVALLLISLMATSAFAVIDSDPNMMGIYFDETADTILKDATPNVPFAAYIMVTNPTYTELSGFEVAYDVVVPAGMEGLYFRLSEGLEGGLNVGNSESPLAGEYIVGWPDPRPTSEAFIAARWNLMLLGEFQAELFLGPTAEPSVDNNLPALEIGGSIVSVGLSTGGPGNAVAIINIADGTEPPIATEVSSFGNLKALFR